MELCAVMSWSRCFSAAASNERCCTSHGTAPVRHSESRVEHLDSSLSISPRRINGFPVGKSKVGRFHGGISAAFGVPAAEDEVYTKQKERVGGKGFQILGSKEKKELRAYAHSLGEDIYVQQVGKNGITPNVITSITDALEANEIIKVTVLENCGSEQDEIIAQLEEGTGAQIVGIIGCNLLVYRASLKKLSATEKKVEKPKRRSRVAMSAGRVAVLGQNCLHTSHEKDGGRKRAGRHAASVALQVDRFKLNQDIEKLSRRESRLLPEALLEALDERIRAGEWQKALKVFELLRRQAWYEPQRAQYLRLLKMLAEYKQCHCASVLCHAMEEDKLPPSVETCTALLNTYVKSGRLDDAFEVFERMKSTTDCHPDVYTYTILIGGLLQVNNLDRVVKLMDEMDKNEVKQNTVTLNILLESFGKTGNVTLMEATFKNMLSNPATYPDIYTWNTLLKSYSTLGRIKEMEEWYSRMQEMEVDPDGITFNILIHAYGKKRDFVKMRNVADHMRSLFFPWNDVTFNAQIEAYGRAQMIPEMEVIYRSMKSKGIKPSAFTWTILLNAFSKERMWEKVEKIRREWKNSDVRADVVMYNSLLEAYRCWGNIRMLEETFQELEHALQPNRASYDILINAYRSFGMRDKYKEAVADLKSFIAKPPNWSDLCSGAAQVQKQDLIFSTCWLRS